MLHRVIAVLFDLDQTLTDRQRSIRVVAEKLRAAYFSNRAEITDDAVERAILAADASGYRPRPEFCKELVAALGWDMAAEDFGDWWRREFPPCAVETDGARQVVAALHAGGYRLGVVTNGRPETQRAKLQALGLLPYFSTIQISEAVGVKKPEPKIFHLALRALGVTPGETLFVGDHPLNDIVGARTIGMNTAWVANPFNWPPHLDAPQIVLYRLAKLLELLPRTCRV